MPRPLTPFERQERYRTRVVPVIKMVAILAGILTVLFFVLVALNVL